MLFLFFFLIYFVSIRFLFFFFFFNDTATTEIYTLSLHDALSISRHLPRAHSHASVSGSAARRRGSRVACRCAMFDVLVVGGGPVGACLGALLAGGACGGVRALSVAVLEPRPPAPLPADAALEARVVALSRASERLLRSAGAWRGIAGPRLSAYERMRIWHESVAPDSEAVLVFDAADVGEPNLGYIVENRLLQGALLEVGRAS